MIEQSILLKLSPPGLAESTTSQLRQEYQGYQILFRLQPADIQQHLESQATQLTNALVNRAVSVHYSLPEAISLPAYNSAGKIIPVPAQFRHQSAGSLLNHLFHSDLQTELSAQISQLEHSSDPAVSASAVLLRHTLVIYMVHKYLQVGRSVQYRAEEGDEIPCMPVTEESAPQSALVSQTDVAHFETEAQIEQSQDLPIADDGGRQGYFLPEWVVVDDQQRLLVANLPAAMAIIQAMQGYLCILNRAVSLAPYMVVDEEFQNKHYGILGQLVNQGRALASYQVGLLCQTIKRRSATHELDRGLRVSLPYFNDQSFTIETYDFDVIPGGRVMFVPAFVVLAVRAEATRVAQNTHLSPSTRKSLLKELCIMERAFLR